MVLARTEAVNAKAKGLDLQPPAAILRLLAEAQVEAAKKRPGRHRRDRAGSRIGG